MFSYTIVFCVPGSGTTDLSQAQAKVPRLGPHFALAGRARSLDICDPGVPVTKPGREKEPGKEDIFGQELNKKREEFFLSQLKDNVFGKWPFLSCNSVAFKFVIL